MTEAAKLLDAVQMMRSIRDRISREIQGLSFEEQRTYIHERLNRSPIARYSQASNAAQEEEASTDTPKTEAGP